MSDLTQIDAIVFDAYGTLFDVASIDRRLEHHFGEKAAEAAALWRRKQLEYTWLCTLMGRYKDFFRLTQDALLFACEELMLTVDVQVIEDLMAHYYQLEVFPDVSRALPRLYDRYPLAILSNANPELLTRAAAHNQIDKWMKGIFSVDSLKQFKPVAEVYQIPAEQLQISKENILFVSSNAWDVAGAGSAGLQVAWVKRKGGVPEKLGFPPTLQVKDLSELSQTVLGA